MRITYYVEVISSWCYWAEPAWKELQNRYAGRAEFVWKLALMDSSGLPASREQCDWFYRRSGTLVASPFMLNSGWFEPALKEYLAPNLVAEAAKDFGVTGDQVRLAVAHAALRDGRRVADWEVSVAAAVAAATGMLNTAELLRHAQSPEIEARARASTAEFYALGATQRPAFLLENSTGDRVVVSGLAKAAPLIAATEALLTDEADQLAYFAHHGGPPPA